MKTKRKNNKAALAMYAAGKAKRVGKVNDTDGMGAYVSPERNRLTEHA